MQELAISHIPAHNGAPARVRVSWRPEIGAQAQEHECDFAFAVTNEQRHDIQWYLEEYLQFPWGDFRTRAREVETMMVQIGQNLFDAIFNCRESRELYARIANDLPNTRIIIKAGDPTGIALPWELLRNPVYAEYGEVARLAHAFVRSDPGIGFTPPPMPKADQLRILMVICRPGGPNLDVPFQSVARPLLELFRPYKEHIQLDVLRPPTFEQLARVLADRPNYYHVLHFDGHGAFHNGTDPTSVDESELRQGCLVFEGEDTPVREIPGEEVGGLLTGKGVPIVLLNACQSGMTHPGSLYPSIGNQIIKAGARGVVAMAYSVYVQTAIRFMARLYQGLINGEELAHTTSLAREELRTHPQRNSPIGEVPLRDWMVPVLFHSAPTELPIAAGRVVLDLGSNWDQQARAGTEIDCPEPPAFGFVGRDNVVLELERGFQDETIVLLTGMAGVGKTEMAAGFARWWAETGALAGPVFFFRFEHYLPLAHVCDRVGQILYPVMNQQPGQEWHLLETAQRRAAVVSMLRQKPCILIWDNLEPVQGFPAGAQSDWKKEEQEELRGFISSLRGGKTRMLITSRRDETWLGGIYRRVEMTGLNMVEAQDLAVRILKRAGMNHKQLGALKEYNKLLEYLDGNPLAMQIILPELIRLSPDELLKALRAGEIELDKDDPQQGRQRSLSASLSYRFNELDQSLRQKMGVLALFQGFADSDTLACISQADDAPAPIRGMESIDWLEVLDAAAEIGIVRQVGVHYYSIHPALPWFLHDLLNETFAASREWLEVAYAEAYRLNGAWLYNEHQKKAHIAIDILAAEEANFLQALRIAQQHQCWEEIRGIIYGLEVLFTTQGRWVELERLLSQVEHDLSNKRSGTTAEIETLQRALLTIRADIALFRRDFGKCEAIYHQLLDYYIKVGNWDLAAAAMSRLGTAALDQARLEEARDWQVKSLAMKQRSGNLARQAVSLHGLAMIAQEEGRFDEAEQGFRQSLAISESLGLEQPISRTMFHLGRVAEERGKYCEGKETSYFAEARQWYEKSLDIVRRIGDVRMNSICVRQLGILSQEMGMLDEAERWHRESLAICEQTGDKENIGAALHELGMVAEERGRLDEARRWYEKSLSIAEEIDGYEGKYLSLRRLGIVAHKQDQLGKAEQLDRRCLDAARRMNDGLKQGEVLEELGTVLQAQGRWNEAAGVFKQALDIFEAMDEDMGMGYMSYHLGEVCEGQNRLRDAQRWYKQAESLFKVSNYEEGLRIAHEALQRMR